MRRLLMLAFAIATFHGVAHADVLYNFTGTGSLAGTFFNVQSTTFLPYSYTLVVPKSGELFYSGVDEGAATGVYFFSSYNIQVNGSGASAASFGLSYNIASVGTYTGPFGTLIVSNTVTPEPSTLALLATGLLGAVGVTRRRWLHRAA